MQQRPTASQLADLHYSNGSRARRGRGAASPLSTQRCAIIAITAACVLGVVAADLYFVRRRGCDEELARLAAKRDQSSEIGAADRLAECISRSNSRGEADECELKWQEEVAMMEADGWGM